MHTCTLLYVHHVCTVEDKLHNNIYVVKQKEERERNSAPKSRGVPNMW